MVFGAFRTRRQLSQDATGGNGQASPVAPAPASYEDQSFDKMGIDLEKIRNIGDDSGKPIPAPVATPPVTPPATPAPAGPPAIGTPAPAGAPAPAPAPAAPGQQQAAGGTDVNYHNHADLLLNHVLGYGLEQVELDGVPVRVADLTPEQEARIVVESYKDLDAYYQSQIAELKKGGTGTAGSTPAEQAVIQALRTGNTEQVLQLIEKNDPYIAMSRMTAEERVKADLKRQYPSYTDADLVAELDALKPDTIERRGRALLDTAKASRQQNMEYLAQLGGGQQQQASQQDTQQEIFAMQQHAATVREIGGIPVGQEHLQYLLQQTIAPNPQTGDTPFIERASTPQGVLEYEFWRTYGPMLLQQERSQRATIENAAYERGKREALLGNYPAQPVHNTPVPTQQTGAVDAGKVDWASVARTGLNVGGN